MTKLVYSDSLGVSPHCRGGVTPPLRSYCGLPSRNLRFLPEKSGFILKYFCQCVSPKLKDIGVESRSVSSPDVAKADREPMVLKIEAFLQELGLQATNVPKRSLYSIMQRPIPVVDTETEAELADLEKLFRD